MTPRLTTEFWIDAYRHRLNLAGIPAFITAKGDPSAGAVLVCLNTLDGQARLYQRSIDVDGQRVWVVLAEGSEADVAIAAKRQQNFDPDLWVIEVEDSAGRHLLDQDGLNS